MLQFEKEEKALCSFLQANFRGNLSDCLPENGRLSAGCKEKTRIDLPRPAGLAPASPRSHPGAAAAIWN